MINSDPAANVRIISRSGEAFSDRVQAGQLLAQEFSSLRGRHAVVLGIPRGGLIVARALAREIDADLDIVLARKLGTPGHEELAMGALAETGEVFLNRNVVEELNIARREIDMEKQRQMLEIQRRSQLIRAVLPCVALEDRIVLVTDDGVATGATIQAAVWAIRHEKPAKLVAAIPVASSEAVERLARDVDEVVCLRMPEYFMAVGQFYRRFDQTTDEEVLAILREEKARKEKSE